MTTYTVVLVLLIHSAFSIKTNHGRFNYPNASYDPAMFKSFLLENRMQQCATRSTQPRLPRSYLIPDGYFDSIPPENRIPPGDHKEPQRVPVCNNIIVPVPALDEYEFETERYLATIGLNIYDGSVWSMALALLGGADEVYKYFDEIISPGETCQFVNVKGDAPCKGVIVKGTCNDENQGGSCGFCYGDVGDPTARKSNAFTFRMISDYWALEGTVDKRCPELGLLWTWNDYRPVLGENSWANLIAPLQVAYIKYGSVTAIPDTDLSITMALNLLPTLTKMVTPIGALYYAPHNTLQAENHDVGFSISTENNVSLLSGLKALRYYLVTKGVFLERLAEINALITAIESYLKLAYSPELGYFRQGGAYDPKTMAFSWATGTIAFAVDCQTWTMSNVHPLLIDQWFGAGTAEAIWAKTKELGGYNYNPITGLVDGFGFTYNQEQIFSGEWSLGAVNMLRIFDKIYPGKNYEAQANRIRDHIQQELLRSQDITTENGAAATVTGIIYANKRYYIPFGWWANPVLSAASTGWAVMADLQFNPFYLGGQYLVNYP